MTDKVNSVLNQALELTAAERVDVVEKLIISLDIPDPAIDALWAKESDARVEAYERGELETVPVEEVFAKYNRS